MSTIKILDLAVSGLDRNTRYKFEFMNAGGNWPIKVSPLSGIFYPDRIKTYVYFCSNSGECPESDSNVFFNLPNTNPSSPGLLLGDKSLYSVLDLIVKDIETSEIVYSHPCIIECDECSPKLTINTNDIVLNSSKAASPYAITFNNLIPNQTYTYTLTGGGGSWPVKVSPLSGTITSHSDAYTAKGIVSICSYSGGCLPTDSVLNYNTDFYSDIASSIEPYSVIKVNLSPADEYLQNSVSDTFIVSCDNCISLPIVTLTENTVLSSTDTYSLSVNFSQLNPNQKYTYQIKTIDSNWPVVAYPISGVIEKSTSKSLSIKTTFCSSTGICEGNTNLLNYNLDNVCNNQFGPLDKFVQFRVELTPIDSSSTIHSNEVIIGCDDCVKALRIDFSSNNVTLTNTNSATTTATISNTIPYKSYSYELENIDSNWPVVVYPISGTTYSTTNSISIPMQLAFCASTGICPQDADLPVLAYTVDNSSFADLGYPNKHSLFRLKVSETECDTKVLYSSPVRLSCLDCLPEPTYDIAISGGPIMSLPLSCCSGNRLIVTSVSGAAPKAQHSYYFESLSNNITLQSPYSGYITFKDSGTHNVFVIANTNLSEYDEGLIKFRLVNNTDSTENIDYLAIKCGVGDCPT